MILTILMVAMLVDQPPKETVCTPADPKKPSLMLVDANGKCQKSYKGVEGKDGKIMYCVNSEKSKPAVCKTQPSQPKK